MMMQQQLIQKQQNFMKRNTPAIANQPAAKKPKTGALSPATTNTITEPGTFIGEIRFSSPASAQQAVQFSGGELGGQSITVELDVKSKDGTRVLVTGLPETVTKHDLKSSFSQCGQIAFADVRTVKPNMGHVRFETPVQAQMALSLNGTNINGYEIQVQLHPGSKDGSKLSISNL